MTMIAPGACRITHGPNDSYFEDIVGKSVASVRRGVATAFDIPADAQPFIGGAPVLPEYRLQAGDAVVFLRTGWGRKAAFPRFGTILADPAWPYRSPRAVVGNGGRGNPNGHAEHIIQVDASAHYPLMTLEEIKALPIKEIAADAAHLYLWTTNAFMEEAHDVARAWGFQPKTILTWVKVKLDRLRVSMKTGYWYRSATEHIVFGVRGSQRLLGPAVPTAYLLPRLPHSEKPGFFYELIEEQSPGPALALIWSFSPAASGLAGMPGGTRSNALSICRERGRMRMLLKNAVAADGGHQPPPACRITHGPCDSYFENIVGKSVASIRRSLASLFSIPDDAEAFVGGSMVALEYRLRAGDEVEFLKRRGRKGVGDLLTPEQLIHRWHITGEQYQQLLKAGLPTIRFEDGTVRHPEPAVDEWLRGGGGGRLKRLTMTDGHDSTEGPPAAKKWCNIEEAARLSGRSVTTIRRDIKGGTLRAHVVGRGRRRPSYRIRRADLKAYIEAGRAEPPDPPGIPTTTVRKKSRHFD